MKAFVPTRELAARCAVEDVPAVRALHRSTQVRVLTLEATAQPDQLCDLDIAAVLAHRAPPCAEHYMRRGYVCASGFDVGADARGSPLQICRCDAVPKGVSHEAIAVAAAARDELAAPPAADEPACVLTAVTADAELASPAGEVDQVLFGVHQGIPSPACATAGMAHHAGESSASSRSASRRRACSTTSLRSRRVSPVPTPDKRPITVCRTASRAFRPQRDHGNGPNSPCTAMLACHTGTPLNASAHLLTVRIVVTDKAPTRIAR